QSWKNHTIKARLKTTGDTYMKHHRNSYEVSVDQAVLLNDADTAKRMLMFRIGNIERPLDRLMERFETEIEAKMEAVMAPLMSELYRWLSKRLDARSRSPPCSRSPPPRRRTHVKHCYNYDDSHSSPKVPRHSRSASVRTVLELYDDTSMEVVEQEEKALVPTAAAEQLVHMATFTPVVTSTPAPAEAATPMPVAPAPAAPAVASTPAVPAPM
ncbi:hypothetical protein PF011_g31743, partial [Phytophthora fragariae]